MTARPMIFNGPMVRALLDGRKTQTRRVLRQQPVGTPWFWEGDEVDPEPGWFDGYESSERCLCGGAEREHTPPLPVPYAVGDLLWVREAHCFSTTGGYDAKDGYDIETGANSVWFRATEAGECEGPWRPSIHMPRQASRLTLEVTAVRVERLQDISEADAIAEGIAPEEGYWRDYLMPSTQICTRPVASFSSLWTSIYGADAWAENPWVVAVSFTVHHANVDTIVRQREAA